MEIKNRTFTIIGVGETGYDTALFLLKRGAKVFVSELRKDIETTKRMNTLASLGAIVEIGKHTEELIKKADFVIPSPGIPEDSIPLKFAKQHNIKVINEIEIAYTFSPSKKVIGVTGTDGKTTVVSLLGKLFKNAKLPSIVCGNIGNSFIGEVDNLSKDTFIILEISSFQLERIKTFKPFIGCLLNVGEDHLDRHLSFKNYLAAKERLFINQQQNDYAILNYNDFYSREAEKKTAGKVLFFSQKEEVLNGVYLKNKQIVYNVEGVKKNIFETKGIQLKGSGNIENIMAVILVGLICKIEPTIIQKTFEEFKSLPYRFEKFAEKRGVAYIDDSKSTNPHSLINALSCLEKDNRTVLIMGGQNKGTSFVKVSPLIKERVKLLVLLGEAKETIAEELKNTGIPYIFADNMEEAVKKGTEKAQKGDTVLLSPACASFDMYKNYKERGDAFKKEVKLLP
jgi:UDP-N-acetylmuramoylalanine--D-glutamate ligase